MMVNPWNMQSKKAPVRDLKLALSPAIWSRLSSSFHVVNYPFLVFIRILMCHITLPILILPPPICIYMTKAAEDIISSNGRVSTKCSLWYCSYLRASLTDQHQANTPCPIAIFFSWTEKCLTSPTSIIVFALVDKYRFSNIRLVPLYPKILHTEGNNQIVLL